MPYIILADYTLTFLGNGKFVKVHHLEKVYNSRTIYSRISIYRTRLFRGLAYIEQMSASRRLTVI